MGRLRRILYSFKGCPNCWRVDIYALEKGIKLEHIEVDLFQIDKAPSIFLQNNPHRQLPFYEEREEAEEDAGEEGGKGETSIFIAESLAIILHLEKYSQGKPLLPQNKKEHSLCMSLSIQSITKLAPTNLGTEVLFKEKTREDLKERINESLKEMSFWNTVLEGRTFLAGDEISIADIAALPQITGDVEVLGLEISQFPHLWRWYKAMWERPSVRDSCSFVAFGLSFNPQKVFAGLLLSS